MTRLAIFWMLHLVILGLFLGELGVVVSIWLRGRVPGLSPHSSRPKKLGAILRASAGVIFLAARPLSHRALARASTFAPLDDSLYN